MKNMKKKLMASVAMLVVSAIMMTSTSYAWYTINTKASADNIRITLVQTKNVEIAKADITNLTMPKEVTADDHEDKYAFGGSIVFGDSETVLDLPTRKVTTLNLSETTEGVYKVGSNAQQTFAEGDLVAPLYQTDGRTDGFVKTVPRTEASTGITYYEYNYYQKDWSASAVDYTKPVAIVAMSYNMFVRSNVGDGTSDYIYLDYTQAEGIDKEKVKISVSYHDCGNIKNPADDALTTTADGYWKSVEASGDHEGAIKVTANHVYLVQIFAYFNGDEIVAADLTDGPIVANMEKLTFTNSAIGTGDTYPEKQTWEDTTEPAAGT